jgi:hypothetical protein
MRKDILLGQQEISCESRGGPSISSNPYSSIWLTVLHVELYMVFNSADEHDGHPTRPDTLLTITISTNASSSLTAAANTSNPATTELDDPVAEGDVVRPTVQL